MTGLPLVSVVVVNHNYGRFLADAVGSVYGQTYAASGGRVECVVVDNASTDETPMVLDALRRAYPDLVVLGRQANDGQGAASLDGLAACSGQYVIFLDADDYLLPRCVETHVYVHLSLRPHVGMTSGDMLQVKDGQVVVASGEESNRYVRRGRGLGRDLVRPYEATAGWPSAEVRSAHRKIRYVPPLNFAWVWSPTSGQCYRRDALALFADNERLRTLRTGTDLYFAFGCSGLSGSALIDEPLFAYRIHGANVFTSHAQLDCTLNFVPGSEGDNNVLAHLLLVDHVVSRVARLTPNAYLKSNMVTLLLRLDRRDPDPSLPRWARRSRVAHAIVREWPGFSAAMGVVRARFLLALFSRSASGPDVLGGRLGLPEARR